MLRQTKRFARSFKDHAERLAASSWRKRLKKSCGVLLEAYYRRPTYREICSTRNELVQINVLRVEFVMSRPWRRRGDWVICNGKHWHSLRAFCPEQVAFRIASSPKKDILHRSTRGRVREFVPSGAAGDRHRTAQNLCNVQETRIHESKELLATYKGLMMNTTSKQ
jgi:hypothetical protein